MAYKKLLGKKGIKVLSVSEPIDDSPEGMVLEGIIEIFDDWYLRLLSREVLRGQKEAAKQGYHVGGQPPYGYQLKKIIVNNIEKSVWEINPSEAENVRLIFSLFSKGYGYIKIIYELDEKNSKPRKADKWSKVSIHDILRKECYSGVRYYNVRKAKDLGVRTLGKNFTKDKSEWIKMKVPQIVDDDTFSAVKERVEKRKKTTVKRQAVYLLTGLLKCGACNASYTFGGLGRDKKYFYYRCSTRLNKGKNVCSNRSIRGDLLDAEIINKVKNVIFTEKNIRKFYSLVGTVKSQEKAELEARTEQNIKGVKELEKKLNNYRKAIEEGVDISLVKDPMNALKNEKLKLEEINRELRVRLENQPEKAAFKFNKEAYKNFMEMVNSFFETAKTDNKRIFLQKFIKEIIVHPDKISIVYTPPIINSLPKNTGPEGLYTVTMVPKRGLEPLQAYTH